MKNLLFLARRGREQEDEIWKQLEQLRLDQLRLGLDVQRVATQSSRSYREEGTVVGKGRSRHTRTSPNQNSLIYKIAQEKAQEMAANQSQSEFKFGLILDILFYTVTSFSRSTTLRV